MKVDKPLDALLKQVREIRKAVNAWIVSSKPRKPYYRRERW